MKIRGGILGILLSAIAIADTPPPGTVKSRTFSGDGNTAVTVSGSSLNVDVTNSVPVIGSFFQATQPVSLLALPSLAVGSNTIGNVNINGTVPISGSITVTNSANGNPGSAIPMQATMVGGSDGTNLHALKASSTGILSVDGSAVVQPVSGAFFQATQPVSGAFFQATQPVSGAFFQATQPVSGTFWQTTQPVSAASLPLPTGAATSAKQPALGTAGVASTDVLSVQGIASMTPLKVDGSGVTQPVSGTFWQATQPVSGTFWQTTQPVSLASSPLPTGAATSALQTTGNTSLASIVTNTANIPAQGQALAAASLPVVLTAAQITTLTPLSSVTVTQATGANLHVVNDAGTAIIGKVGIDQTTPGTTNGVQVNAALPAGTNLMGKVGIDQTTPGTTNGVQVNAALPAGTNVIGTVNVQPISGATDSQTTGTVSTVITLTAPSNAQGFILQNLQTSTANLRFAMGATATTTLGMQLAPGQDSGFVPTSASVTIVSESGTNGYNIQWVAK